MSSESYKQLRQLLKDKNTLTPDDLERITKEHGALSDVEHIELEALRLKLDKESRAAVTMDEYLKATKILDSAAEGSEEHTAALAIVEAFEGGG